MLEIFVSGVVFSGVSKLYFHVLKGTVKKEKHEILFSEFGVNYNDEPQMFRKGTYLYRKRVSI